MQKTFIAFLALVALLLSAALLRTQSRVRHLEERLAAAERARSPRPAPARSRGPAEEAPPPAVPPVTAAKPVPPEDPFFPEEKISPPPQARTLTSSPKVLSPGPDGTYRFSDNPLVLSTPAAPPPESRRPGYLGIIGSDAEGGGVLVSQVQPGTVAGLSGLREGDVILEVNGEKVANYGDLAAKMRMTGEGAPVTLRIRRGAAEFYQGAQLGPRPP